MSNRRQGILHNNRIRWTLGIFIFLIAIFSFFFIPNTTAVSAWLGNRDAMYKMGKYYSRLPDFTQNFKPIPKSYKPVLARYWYFRAANNNHAEAMVEIAEEFDYSPISYYGYRPRWLPYDHDKFLFWIKKGANAGSSRAMEKLANHYRYRFPHESNDTDLAIEWYQKSAESGGWIAAIELGNIYRSGDMGQNVDYNKSNYYFAIARKVRIQLGLQRP